MSRHQNQGAVGVRHAIIASELEGITGWLECIAILFNEHDDGNDGARVFLIHQLDIQVRRLREELRKLLGEDAE